MKRHEIREKFDLGGPNSGHRGHTGGRGGPGNPGGSKPRSGGQLGTTERKMYEPTRGNEKKWARYAPVEMPSDEVFKARWAKAHHGKERGWGMGKRNFVLSQMTLTRDYQMGLWQGRVDAARKIGYSEERNENTYNLGYHRGYSDYASNRRGWDSATRARFDEKYTDAP